MKKSVEKLKKFLEDEYINNEEMQSPDISAAIRDLLTDSLHLGKEEGVDMFTRMMDAQEVFDEECPYNGA